MTRELLTASEFRRFIARMGGLWSSGMLGDVCGDRLRRAVGDHDFPAPVWRVGRTRLYGGWDVHDWLLSRERWYEAQVLDAELQGLERRKFAQEA